MAPSSYAAVYPLIRGGGLFVMLMGAAILLGAMLATGRQVPA